jgi:bile acid:Na+ symporter, BASS family
MLSMGITLTPDDFVQVAKTPVPTIMQFILCYGMMPGLAYGLGKAFGLSPALTAGMVLVGCINGGQASNLCTYIARGNVALSVLMTTATTLGAIVMTPVLCKAILGTVVPVDAAGIAMSTVQVSQSMHRSTVSLYKRNVILILLCPFAGRFGSYRDRHVPEPILPQDC